MTTNAPTPDQIQSALNALETTLSDAEIAVGAEYRDGSVVLSGEVDNEEDRQAALDVAAATVGRLGLPVTDALDVLDFSAQAEVDGGGDVYDAEDWQGAAPGAAFDKVEEPPQLDPDFAGSPGTTDSLEAAEEGETYFPPTDPVVRPSDDAEGLEVLNGFAASSLSGLESDSVTLPDWTDDELAAHVKLALRNDAATTDLAIRVIARGTVVHLHGEVPTLEDAENAEAVAADVPGVSEVREELVIPGLLRDRTGG